MNTISLSRNEVNVILVAKGTLISFNEKLKTCKDRLENFDITVGLDDSAQVTDLVGLYLLQQIKSFCISEADYTRAMPCLHSASMVRWILG